MILTEILEISLAGRAPKQDPLLFALALCARYSFKMNKSEASESEETEEDESYIAMQQKYFAQLNRAAFLSVNKVNFLIRKIILCKSISICNLGTCLLS